MPDRFNAREGTLDGSALSFTGSDRRRCMRPSSRAQDAVALAAIDWRAPDRSKQARRGSNGRLLLFNDGRTRSAIAGGIGSDPGSARLHTASLRVSRPLPGTRRVRGGIVRLEHTTHRLSARNGRTLAFPFEILSDADLPFANALALPTFETGGMRLIKRLTLIIRGGRIESVF